MGTGSSIANQETEFSRHSQALDTLEQTAGGTGVGIQTQPPSNSLPISFFLIFFNEFVNSHFWRQNDRGGIFYILSLQLIIIALA